MATRARRHAADLAWPETAQRPGLDRRHRAQQCVVLLEENGETGMKVLAQAQQLGHARAADGQSQFNLSADVRVQQIGLAPPEVTKQMSRLLGAIGLLAASTGLLLMLLPLTLGGWVFGTLLFVMGFAASGWNGVLVAEVTRLAGSHRAGELTGRVLAYGYLGLAFAPRRICLDRRSGEYTHGLRLPVHRDGCGCLWPDGSAAR